MLYAMPCYAMLCVMLWKGMLWYGIQSLDPRWRRKQSPNAQIMLVGGACRVHRSIAVRPWVPVGFNIVEMQIGDSFTACLLYTSPSPRDLSTSRMPSSA